jgi:hypothetical protein
LSPAPAAFKIHNADEQIYVATIGPNPKVYRYDIDGSNETLIGTLANSDLTGVQSIDIDETNNTIHICWQDPVANRGRFYTIATSGVGGFTLEATHPNGSGMVVSGNNLFTFLGYANAHIVDLRIDYTTFVIHEVIIPSGGPGRLGFKHSNTDCWFQNGVGSPTLYRDNINGGGNEVSQRTSPGGNSNVIYHSANDDNLYLTEGVLFPTRFPALATTAANDETITCGSGDAYDAEWLDVFEGT